MEPKGKGGGYRNLVEQLVEKRLRSSWGRPNTPLHKQTVATEMHEMIIKIPDDDNDGTEETNNRLWSEVGKRCESHPHEASRIDCRGRTCLHVACTKNPPASVVTALIAASSRYYEGILERDKHGNTPLALAVACKRNCCSVTLIRRLLQCCPRAAAVSDHNGFLPLHTACRKDRNERQEIVERLLEAYPAGAARECNSGRTPLHCAIESGTAQVELVTLLAQACPESVLMNGCGVNPLVLAIRKRCASEIILALIEANSDAITSRDRCNGFPLRRAVELSAPMVVLQALLPEASPEVIIMDLDSITHDIVLHSALDCGIPDDAVSRLLLEPAPQQAALWKSRHGTTPLAIACRRFLLGTDRRHALWDSVSLFLRAAWYNRIDDSDDDEDNDPIVHAAVGLGTPVQVIDMAIELHPEQLSQRDQDGAFPLHLLLVVVGSSRNDDDERTQLILRMVEAYPPAATTPTRQGQTTLAVAAGARPIVGPQVLQHLVVANPTALRRLDPISGLYPFQIAALFATDEHEKDSSAVAERMQLTAIFTLLVGAPDLVVTTFS